MEKSIEPLASNTGLKSVLIFPNPAGLSIGQLEAGINDAKSIKRLENAAGWNTQGKL